MTIDPDSPELCRTNKLNDPNLIGFPLPDGNESGLSVKLPLQGGFLVFYKLAQVAEKQEISNEY
ncbi:hypothetical protein ACS5NO_02925 [Larkinella sp. GY13]|uniref:hypothetical protein n=1 Tax=Larkinella sp. GY13 TaxID=3453720 RepID=UPI003EE82AC9